MKKFALLLGCAFVAASCGGGGSNAPAVQPVTTYRANQVGDSWNYSLTINLGKQGVGTGTLTHGLTADTYNGQPSIRDSETFLFQLKSGLTNSTSYSEDSLQGALLATSVNGTLLAVTSDTFSTGNTLSPTTSDSGVITISNGDTLTETFKVVGTEMIDTPAGQFATWVAKQTVVDASGVTDNFTIWIAPETGSYVKISDVTTTPVGVAYTYTATLTAIVVPADNVAPSGHAAKIQLPRIQIHPSTATPKSRPEGRYLS